MKLTIVSESVQDQIQELSYKHDKPPLEITDNCKSISHKYWKWILKLWYYNKIILPEDKHRIRTALDNFQQVYHQLPPDQKSIDRYNTITELENLVKPILGIKPSTKVHKNIESFPGVEIISRNGPYLIAEITDSDSLAELGKGTKWCTRNGYPGDIAGEYLRDYGSMLIIFQNGRPLIQFTPDYDQIHDINDDVVTDERLLSLIPPPKLSGDISNIYGYIIYVLKKRWPEAEGRIIEEPVCAYNYAKNFIRSRWTAAEPMISQSPTYAYLYAKNIINGPWPEAEETILKSRLAALHYTIYVLKERWPDLEKLIKPPFHRNHDIIAKYDEVFGTNLLKS